MRREDSHVDLGGSQDPLIGTTIAGRYRVVRLIGKGGMGQVYEVEHLRLGRTFALKRLLPELARHPDALARFRREAEAIARLRHPHVVAITDWETLDDGSPCLVMEQLFGRDLGDRIARSGPLPWPLIGRIADQVMGVLSVAHRLGIVHRDLKPQNIFIAEDGAGEGHAKLFDFGVSKIRHAETIDTHKGERLIGTPPYMAPEQANSESDAIGPATDVWAMGVILFEMATARLPFPAESMMTILYRICHGEPEPLAPLRPDAPPAFAALVGRALDRDPARRLRHMDELRRGLREALAEVAPGAFTEPLIAADYTGTATPVPDGDPPLGLATTLSRATGQVSGDRTRGRRRLAVVAGGVAAVAAVLVTVAVVAVVALAPGAGRRNPIQNLRQEDGKTGGEPRSGARIDAPPSALPGESPGEHPPDAGAPAAEVVAEPPVRRPAKRTPPPMRRPPPPLSP